MEHFYNNIHGWFDFHDLYSRMVQEASSGYHFVEIGAFYGKSTSYMAVEIINSGKNIKFDVVDTWRGSLEHQQDAWDAQEAMINDTAFDIFKLNLISVKDHFNPIKLPSIEASKLYQDKSLDFVYIDAAHEYEFVKPDIEAWLPKVKVGGYIGGHDYQNYTMPSGSSFGVIQAVDETFKGDIELLKGSGSWTYSWLHKVK